MLRNRKFVSLLLLCCFLFFIAAPAYAEDEKEMSYMLLDENAVNFNARTIPISDFLAAEFNLNADDIDYAYEIDITDENRQDILEAYRINQPDFADGIKPVSEKSTIIYPKLDQIPEIFVEPASTARIANYQRERPPFDVQ